MVIRYQGTSPKLGSCQGECPYPCDYVSFLIVFFWFLSFQLYLQQPSILVFVAGRGRSHGALDLSEKQLETRTENICVIRWSKPSGVYIMNFYLPKYVSRKETESRGHTRCSRGTGRAQGVGHALHPRGGLMSSPDCYLFFYFSKYSKTDKNCHQSCFGVGLLTVPCTYAFLEFGTFWKVSLMYSSRVMVSITLVSTLIGLPEI